MTVVLGEGKVLAGWGEDCGRVGEGDASSIFIPDTQRTVNEVALVIKAVYQLGNLQKLSAREPMLGSGAVCIDLPSRLNCARRCRKEPRVPVSCVVLCEDTGDCRNILFEHFPREKSSWPWKRHPRWCLSKRVTERGKIAGPVMEKMQQITFTWTGRGEDANVKSL